MKIPPFWKKETYEQTSLNGESHFCEAWGWSFESLGRASDDAIARCKRIFNAMAEGRKPERYGYFDQPFREEIVESIGFEENPTAVITRNRYGALVLNTEHVCFVDIDFPEASKTTSGSGGFLSRLFSGSGKKSAEDIQFEAWELAEQNVREWARHHPDRTFRLYRTAAGLRLLFTDQLYDPASDDVNVLFERLGCDPLYRTLTRKQECFRARLTPKPWRCGCSTPPNRFPWENNKDEQAYRQWTRKYEAKIVPLAVCEFVEGLGENLPVELNPAIQAIVDLHDEHTCRRKGTTLA